MSEAVEDDAQVSTVHRIDGDPVGVSVTLSPADLEELGIDPDEADEVRFAVEDGEARFW